MAEAFKIWEEVVMIEPRMTERELATVLTALRYWQAALPEGIAVYGDIATDGGRFEPLSTHEIDELCMNLSCGKPS
jgi:hypothetical protein